MRKIARNSHLKFGRRVREKPFKSDSVALAKVQGPTNVDFMHQLAKLYLKRRGGGGGWYVLKQIRNELLRS